MSLRKYLVTASLVLFFGLFAFAIPAHAYSPFDDVCNTGANSSSSTVCKGKDNTGNPLVGPNGIITKSIQLINFVVGVAAVFIIMISGIRMIISQGDSNTISSARNAILGAVIGLFVVLTAQMIVVFVIKRL